MSKKMIAFFEAEQLCRTVVPVTTKVQPQLETMHTLCVDVLAHLYRANALSLESNIQYQKRHEHQQQVLTSLKIIDFLADIALTQQYLLVKHYQQIIEQTALLKQLIDSWISRETTSEPLAKA